MTNNNISLTIIANGHFFVAVQHGCYMIIVQMIKNVFQSSITLKKGTKDSNYYLKRQHIF